MYIEGNNILICLYKNANCHFTNIGCRSVKNKISFVPIITFD